MVLKEFSYADSVVKGGKPVVRKIENMGPQTEAEGNVPKDGDPSEEELPPIPAGTYLGLQDDEAGSSDDADEDGDGVDRGGYQLLNGDIDAEVGEVASWCLRFHAAARRSSYMFTLTMAK